MNTWQPIETAPKDGTVIFIGADEWVDIACWDGYETEQGETGYWCTLKGSDIPPTRWFPLLAPTAPAIGETPQMETIFFYPGGCLDDLEALVCVKPLSSPQT
jgi:hypothetical protein